MKGMDKTHHHQPISQKDLQKLEQSEALSVNTPAGLLRRVWFNVTLYFGRRGCEGQRMLCKDSFKVKFDDDGREFVEICINEKQKNHPGRVNDKQTKFGRMYSLPSSENCSVRAFKAYIEKLNP